MLQITSGRGISSRSERRIRSSDAVIGNTALESVALVPLPLPGGIGYGLVVHHDVNDLVGEGGKTRPVIQKMKRLGSAGKGHGGFSNNEAIHDRG